MLVELFITALLAALNIPLTSTLLTPLNGAHRDRALLIMMRWRTDSASVFLTAFSIWIWALAIHPVGCLKKSRKAQNSILDVQTSCSTDIMNVTVVMEREFQGVIYTRGFPLECRVIGSGQNFVTLQITASGCGVRMVPHKNGGLVYHVVLEIQMARHLQQATDPSTPASCHLTEDKMVLHSPALQIVQKQNSRTGRKMEMDDVKKKESKQEAMAWLEIEGSVPPHTENINRVNVGELTTLRVKTWLPETIGSKVVDCLAHDGIGESSQQLIDADGCPTDELLVPSFHHQLVANDSHDGYRMAIESTLFPAFKFPDRDAVHIRCGLLLCSNDCPKTTCSHENLKVATARHNRKMGSEDNVIDYIQLFNSVEVIAPGIETDNLKQYKRLPNNDELTKVFSDFGDQPFCLSAPKMAMSFATLGMVFLSAVAISLYVLLKNRLQRKSLRRLSGFDMTSEQNLLVIRDSPSFSRTISVWSYGR